MTGRSVGACLLKVSGVVMRCFRGVAGLGKVPMESVGEQLRTLRADPWLAGDSG